MSQKGPINQKAVIAYCHKDKSYQKAIELAKKLYAKRKRKYSGVAYWSHPLTVASLLLEVGVASEAMVASALQDTLTHSTLKEATIRAEFGDVVADMVLVLTPLSGELEALAFAAYKAKLAGASPGVQTIKLASILDDLCAIPTSKVSAESEFIDNCAELAGVLTLGNAELARRVQSVIRLARS